MDLNFSAVRLVALDLDDTTLDNKSALAPETRRPSSAASTPVSP